MCSYCGGRDAYRKVRFMIKQIRMLLVALSVIFFMTACKDTAGYTAVQSMWHKDMLLSLKQALLEKAIASYYGGDGTAAAMAFMKHKSVQRFMAMWVHEETKDIDQPIWNYDSFARVSIRRSCTQISNSTPVHLRMDTVAGGTVFSSMMKRNPQYQTGR